MRASHLCCVAFSALILCGVSGTPLLEAQTAASDSAALHERARQFSAAYVRGDADAMTELYTADAVLFPEQSAPITGHEAVRRYWTLAPRRRITRHVLMPARITVDGEHAYDYGTFEIAGERDGTAWGPFRGKYVIVWRREGGSWRMHLDIWNSGPRPPS
jgi:ketosteroid isomerase-like protein